MKTLIQQLLLKKKKPTQDVPTDKNTTITVFCGYLTQTYVELKHLSVLKFNILLLMLP